MYRYLFEEACFDLSFESDKLLDTDLQSRVRAAVAKVLGLKYEDIRLVYYRKSEGITELEYESRVKVDQNFEFRIALVISSYDKTLISLKTFISRLDPVYLRSISSSESIVNNIFKEFAKNSFYQDIFADYKRKYEAVSRKLYEELEVLFGF